MSRIGRKPIDVPGNVKIAINGNTINVEGPKGKLQWEHHPDVSLQHDEDSKKIVVSRISDDRGPRALHGLTRALVQNMIIGVTDGYEKRLESVGVGYLAAISGTTLQLRVGFANEIHKEIPATLDVKCPDQTHVVIKGCDKQQVGEFAASVRAARKPEPYKGKGVRYQGEHVKIKPGKTAS